MMIRLIVFEETYPLRKKVLRNDLGSNKVPFDGDDLPNSYHFGYFVDDNLIGILSAIEHSDNNYQFRGLAILPEFQKQNKGAELLQFAEGFLKSKNVGLIKLNAREIAVGFYKNNGYNVSSSAFEIEGIGTHYEMKKAI